MKAATRQMKQRKGQHGPKQHGPKLPKPPEIPVNTAESNAKGDRMSMAVFAALIVASLSTLGFGVYFSATNFNLALSRTPVDWVLLVGMTLLLAATFLVARSLFWLAFFGSVMFAAKIGAWKTCEANCRRAIKLPPSLSRGSSWAAVALVQSLVNRGLYKDAIAEAEEEWKRSGEDSRQVQNLGPLCVAVGIASQVEEDLKESLTWNERAITCLTKSLEDLSKPKKGLVGKAMSPQTTEWLGQVRTQLAVAHFNIATIYFQRQDHRRAKENFKKSVDYAQQAPDFPQKSDILKMGRDQLGRLKHA